MPLVEVVDRLRKMQIRSVIERTLYRYGWDTRCRNLSSALKVRAALSSIQLNGSPALLDVGSGGLGIPAFLKGVRAIGVDREQPVKLSPGLEFHRADVTALPYLDRSFPVVSCIDVLEHLSLEARPKAIREVVRVAKSAVLIACPHGPTAEKCDEEFRRTCERRGRPVPEWLREHQRHAYPIASSVVRCIQEAASGTGRRARVSLSYCEPAVICRSVRAAAASSDALYVATNLIMGIMYSIFPSPGAANSYRMIALAELASNH